MDFKQELSKKISNLTGTAVTDRHIYSDKGNPFHYYIRKLQPGRPVMCCHYRGAFMLVLPESDYGLLETGVKTVDGYIETSHWSYGYYWGGGSLLGGSYWRPLEDGAGIHDTEKISRYMRLLQCRTAFRASGHQPMPEECQECHLCPQSCPCSPLKESADWTNEVQEPDGRMDLFKALTERIKDETGFAVNPSGLYLHDGDMDEAYLLPVSYKPNTVEIWLNNQLLNALLYAPDTSYDWADLASSLSFVAAKRDWQNGQIICQPISKDNPWPTGVCLEHWGEELQKAWRVLEETPVWTEKMHDAGRFKAITPIATTPLQWVGDLLYALFGKK